MNKLENADSAEAEIVSLFLLVVRINSWVQTRTHVTLNMFPRQKRVGSMQQWWVSLAGNLFPVNMMCCPVQENSYCLLQHVQLQLQTYMQIWQQNFQIKYKVRHLRLSEFEQNSWQISHWNFGV